MRQLLLVGASALALAGCAPLLPTSNAGWPSYGGSSYGTTPPVFYSLSGAQYPSLDPATGAYFYHPLTPPQPPVATAPVNLRDNSPVARVPVPAPVDLADPASLLPVPRPRPGVDTEANASPPKPKTELSPVEPAPPPASEDACIGAWRICHFIP